jgi:hypothetical protein
MDLEPEASRRTGLDRISVKKHTQDPDEIAQFLGLE